MVSAMADPQHQSLTPDGDAVNHLLVGDMNQHTWLDKNDVRYHEWLGETGMWELNDPAKPTHVKG